MFLRLYLLPAPRGGRFSAEDALDHTQNLPKRSSATGLVFTSHKNAVVGCAGLPQSSVVSWGHWDLLTALFCSAALASPGGKADWEGAPWGPFIWKGGHSQKPSHWPELCPVITIATKGPGKMGTRHSSSKGGTAVAVR